MLSSSSGVRAGGFGDMPTNNLVASRQIVKGEDKSSCKLLVASGSRVIHWPLPDPLPPHLQVAPVEDRVERQVEAAVGLVAPERTVGEHHHVTLAERGIDHDRAAGQRLLADEPAAEQYVVRVGREAQDDARSRS